MNFSNNTNSSHIIGDGFVCSHYHLCEIATQIIEWIFFAPYELYNNNLLHAYRRRSVKKPYF